LQELPAFIVVEQVGGSWRGMSGTVSWRLRPRPVVQFRK
jgi:hypothetical protein